MQAEYLQDAKEWLVFAETDYGVAARLFEVYRPLPLEIICFHCQQAAEKAVKAVITLYGSPGGLPKSHDVLLLLNQIKNRVTIENELLSFADILTPYGIVMRYPHELFLEERHAKKAIEMAAAFIRWAKEQIK